MSYLGDFPEDFADLNFKFNTRQFSTGAPFALAGTPVVSVYKSNGATQSTAGITLTNPFDSVVGLMHVNIDLSADAFYAVGEAYQVVLTAGTVDSVSVIGAVLADFSIEIPGGAIALLTGTNSLSDIEDKIDIIDANVDQIETAVITNAAGVDIAADIIAVKADTTAILVDTADMQPKLGTPAGASISADILVIDTNVDDIETAVITNAAGTDIAADIIAVKSDTTAILVDTGTTLNDKIDIIDTNVDDIETAVITNAAGTDIAADIIAVKAQTVAIETDTQDIQTRLPSALVSGRMSSDMVALSGSTDAADKLEAGAKQIITTTVTGATSTTTVIASGLSGFTPNDILNNRQIYFEDGPAGGATSDVTAFDATTEKLTFTEIATAPANGNTFVLS